MRRPTPTSLGVGHTRRPVRDAKEDNVIHTKPRMATNWLDELSARADRLARGIRVAPKFTDVLTWWAGYPLKRVPAEPDQPHVVDEHERMLLDLPAGTEVLRRSGVLVPHHADSPVLATIKSLVYPPRLGLTSTQSGLLRGGATPVGALIPDAPRGVHFTIRLDTEPEPDVPALVSRATLYPGGMPAVLADEVVFWRVLRDRAPQRGALFPCPVPTSVPVW